MKWHIRLTQQNLGYMFRSKSEAIIRLIMTLSMQEQEQKLVASRRGYLKFLDITYVPTQHVTGYK
jgi:hypothetical protein